MNEWTKEWPTEPGNYWYWGYFYDIDDDGLHFVNAYTHAGDMFIMAGSIVVYCEGVKFNPDWCHGHWMKADTPNPPETA